jgi:hypothetical protein
MVVVGIMVRMRQDLIEYTIKWNFYYMCHIGLVNFDIEMYSWIGYD